MITETTSSGTTTYTYDFANRMTNADINGTMAATYTYDALGRRISIDDSGTKTWTVYNGKTADDNPYADFTSAGSLQTRYVDGLAVDDLFARTDSSGNTAWYLRDNIGSFYADVTTTMVLDAVVYDPFGNLVTETNASEGDRFKFAGMEYDSVTGLYYDHARYYDAAIGRFVSQDPMAYGAGDADTYRYTGNAPTNSVDPSGTIAIPPTLIDPFYRPPGMVHPKHGAIFSGPDLRTGQPIGATMTDDWDPTFLTGREHGGWIFQNPHDGTLKTVPVPPGKGGRLHFGYPPYVPGGYYVIGIWHPHPGPEPGPVSPSPFDRKQIKPYRIRGFVVGGPEDVTPY